MEYLLPMWGEYLSRIPQLDARRSWWAVYINSVGKTAAATGISFKTTAVKRHNSLALGERFHAPLHRLFNVVHHSEPTRIPEMAVRISKRSLNDTMGPNGLVPTFLVYGILPRFPDSDSDFPGQQARMRALSVARREMETIVAQLRIPQALRARILTTENYIIAPGDRIRVFRETE